MEAMNVVVPQPFQLRAVETFIDGYKKLTPEDVRNIKRMSYEDLQKAFRKDPVKLMVEAADLGMDLGQYGNMVSPQTRIEQGRNIVNRLMEDEAIYIRETDMSAPSTVGECLDGGSSSSRCCFYALTKAWDKEHAFRIGKRNSIHASDKFQSSAYSAECGYAGSTAAGRRGAPFESR